MTFLLIGLLSLISFGCFLEGKLVERRGLKLVLSLLLSLLLPFIMTGSMEALIVSGMFQGFLLYLVLHTVIPTITFFIFQLLLYNIKLFD